MYGFASAFEGRQVSVKLIGPVGAEFEGIEFECQLSCIKVAFQLSGFLGLDDGSPKSLKPFLHDFGNPVAHWARSAIKLGRRRREKASATKDPALHMGQPDVTQIPESRQPLSSLERWFNDLFDKDRASGFNSRDLQIFFGAKVCKQAALAHREFEREAPDSQTFETLF